MSVEKRYWHDVVGYNYRMTNIQAAIGCAQIERIETILDERKEIEEQYKNILKNFPYIQIQNVFDDRTKVTWLVSALVEESRIESLVTLFQANKIDVRHFFYPLSDMPIYNQYLFSNRNAKKLSRRGISFPTHKGVDFGLIRTLLEN
jgi:perosamine synthetase